MILSQKKILDRLSIRKDEINLYLYTIIVIFLIRNLLQFILFDGYYSILQIQYLIIYIVYLLLNNKYKRNYIVILIFFYSQITLNAINIIFNRGLYGYELYFFQSVGESFLFLSIKNNKKILFSIMIFILMFLLFITYIKYGNLEYEFLIKNSSYSYIFNLFFTYILMLVLIMFIYRKHELEIVSSNLDIEEKNKELDIAFNVSNQQLIKLIRKRDNFFMIRFQEIYPEFSDNLLKNNHNITNNEIKLCAMIFLNISNKDIANFFNVEPTTIISKKYYIKKKLNIDKNISVQHFFNNLNLYNKC